MVSGLRTSPKDQLRMSSWLARLIVTKAVSVTCVLRMFVAVVVMWVSGPSGLAAAVQLHVEAQAPDLVGEHVEGDRRAGLEHVGSLDHRLVDARAPLDVVALHGEQLLEDGRG